MAPKAKAKKKATKTLAKHVTAKVKKGKWIGKMKKDAVTKQKRNDDKEADDVAEADGEDERAPADENEENQDLLSNGVEDDEDGFSNENAKSKAHGELMKKIHEFRKKIKASGTIEKKGCQTDEGSLLQDPAELIVADGRQTHHGEQHESW